MPESYFFPLDWNRKNLLDCCDSVIHVHDHQYHSFDLENHLTPAGPFFPSCSIQTHALSKTHHSSLFLCDGKFVLKYYYNHFTNLEDRFSFHLYLMCYFVHDCLHESLYMYFHIDDYFDIQRCIVVLADWLDCSVSHFLWQVCKFERKGSGNFKC